jgi:P4 family phage/plasmid primase-like protien
VSDKKELTPQQEAYYARQKERDEAVNALSVTSDEAKERLIKKYGKDQKSLQIVLDTKPELIQKYYPFLMDAPKDRANLALSFLGWSYYNESPSIFNHHDGEYFYSKTREVWEHHRGEDGEYVTDPVTGRWIKLNERVAGTKWRLGKGEGGRFPFPKSLFDLVWDFGTVIVCEGEKDAINLNLYGVPALTLGGTSEKWSLFKETLAGMDVIIWLDNDESGRNAADRFFNELKDVCTSLMIVDWRRLDPSAENKADASDYLLKVGRIGADALLRRLKNSRFTVSVTKSWEEVAGAMMEKMSPLHHERDNELAEMMKIFIDVLKRDPESKAYSAIMDRANASLRKYPEKAELVRISRLDNLSDDEKENIKEYEKKCAKGVALLEDACEDAVLYEYFDKAMVGDMRKHVAADVVIHWHDSFRAVGVDFVRLSGQYLFWCGTHYHPVTDTQLSNSFNRFLEMARVNPKQRENYGTFKRPALESIRDKAYHIDDNKSRWEEYAIINHQGGTIIIDEAGNIQHKAHERDDCMTYVLPFAYDPNAKAKKWHKVLERILPDEAVRMVVQEYIGYLFLPGYLQNFLFLYGQGANGKSLLIKVIAALFDKKDVSNLTVQDMYDHKLHALRGKKLNISSELAGNATAHGQIETVKLIAEGGTITIDPKHEAPYDLNTPPKLVMSANTKLTGGGQNDGLIRRLIMIPFDVQIPKHERNAKLHKEIIAEEMPGVLNWAIEGLIRLVQNDNQFTQSNILDSAIEEYREETDQVYLYIKECLGQYVGAIPDDERMVRKVHDLPIIYNSRIMIPTKSVYQHYCLWAKESGVHEMKQPTFISKLCEKLKTKAENKRYKALTIKKTFAGGESSMAYESKTGNVLVGFSITGDIMLNVGGMNVTVMQTIEQGE